MNLRATVSRSRRPSLTAMALAAVLGVSLSACAPQYRNHGYTPTDAELAEIVVGVDTRDSVAETVGAPTSAGILAGSDYYYVSSKVRHFGAAAPKEVERKLVAISFDDGGVVPVGLTTALGSIAAVFRSPQTTVASGKVLRSEASTRTLRSDDDTRQRPARALPSKRIAAALRSAWVGVPPAIA